MLPFNFTHSSILNVHADEDLCINENKLPSSTSVGKTKMRARVKHDIFPLNSLFVVSFSNRNVLKLNFNAVEKSALKLGSGLVDTSKMIFFFHGK